jgi:hypothetical protein
MGNRIRTTAAYSVAKRLVEAAFYREHLKRKWRRPQKRSKSS